MFDLIIDHMEKGYSKDSIAGLLRISRDTLYQWVKKYSDFSDTIKEGEELSRLFWEQKANDHLTHYKDGKQLNSTVWIFNMKNRFGWRDKIDVEEKQTSDVNVEISFSKKTEPDTE
jgi:transposase